MRAAPNQSKAELFAALETAACETPDLCQLKRLCVAGYALHLHALAETTRAKALLTEVDGEAEASRALTTAERELAEATQKLARCADAQGEATRKYRP